MRPFIIVIISCISFVGTAQVLWTNPITGTDPNTSNPYTTGQTLDANISVSGIGRGTGITGTSANDRYNANSWNTASIDLTAYFEFTLTANVSCEIDFTSLVYTSQSSGTGPTSFAFRSNLDGFASNIGTPNATGTTIALSSGSYQNISSPITFRFYAWGASAAGGTFSINDFTFNGSTSCGSNSITTGTILTSPFLLNCSTGASGTVEFTSVGTFTAGNTYTVQLSDASGDFTSPTTIGSLNSTANNGTIPFSIPAGTISGTAYRIRVISNTPSTIGSDNGVNLTITNDCTITTGLVSSSTFSVSCSAGTAGSVDFTASGTMLAGNIYSAQLSDASGNFTVATTIGTLNSTSNSGTIPFTIPLGTPSGTGYLIRVISSNPSTTGTNSTVLTITLSDGPCVQEPPHLTSVIINSCDPTCDEGYNEIVFGTSGDYSFTVNTTNFDFLYGSTFPGTNYTDVLVNNATGISQLNAAAGCPGLFVDATGTTIPANASWMLVYKDICEEALTWNGLCGTGPIYVIFQNDANWNTSGNFVNNPDATSPTRYFRTAITTTSGSTFTIDYTTNGSYPNSDGVYATFDSDGGPAAVYGDNNCILSPALLPSSLLSFDGIYVNLQTELFWQTISEQNNAYFTLSHSTNGFDFEKIGVVNGAGNSTELHDYRFIHSFPHPGLNYYQLHSTDFDGTTYFKGIIAIEALFNFSYFNNQTSTIELAYESDVSIFSMDGKLIEEKNGVKSIHFDRSGMFILLDRRTGISERLFSP